MTSPSQDAAFKAMFEAHHRAIQAYCWRRLPAALADDAAADVFLTVWRKMDDAPPGAGARLWIYGIARNVVRNASRASHRRSRLDARLAAQPASSVESAEAITVRHDDELKRLALLDQLRPGEREILLLRVWAL